MKLVNNLFLKDVFVSQNYLIMHSLDYLWVCTLFILVLNFYFAFKYLIYTINDEIRDTVIKVVA